VATEAWNLNYLHSHLASNQQFRVIQNVSCMTESVTVWTTCKEILGGATNAWETIRKLPVADQHKTKDPGTIICTNYLIEKAVTVWWNDVFGIVSQQSPQRMVFSQVQILPALPCPEAVHTCPAHKGYKIKHLLCIAIPNMYLLGLMEEKNK
jgi:hypothetical protein